MGCWKDKTVTCFSRGEALRCFCRVGNGDKGPAVDEMKCNAWPGSGDCAPNKKIIAARGCDGITAMSKNGVSGGLSAGCHACDNSGHGFAGSGCSVLAC